MPTKNFIPQKLRAWIEARGKFKLSHKHIQMARELGMSPKSFGKLNNHKQNPWKAPLPIFIEDLYFERFNRFEPDEIKTIEQVAKIQREKKEAKNATKPTKTEAMIKPPEDEWPF